MLCVLIKKKILSHASAKKTKGLKCFKFLTFYCSFSSDVVAVKVLSSRRVGINRKRSETKCVCVGGGGGGQKLRSSSPLPLIHLKKRLLCLLLLFCFSFSFFALGLLFVFVFRLFACSAIRINLMQKLFRKA